MPVAESCNRGTRPTPGSAGSARVGGAEDRAARLVGRGTGWSQDRICRPYRAAATALGCGGHRPNREQSRHALSGPFRPRRAVVTRVSAGFLPPAPARVVEIGCGRGALAAALIAAGYDLTGVEPDPDAADTARSRGVRVLGCPIEDCAPGDRTYDVALFTRSLHHGTDLDGCLGPAARLLRAGGRIVIEEFAREDADLAAAGFVDDSLALLEAAGLARPRSSGQTDPDADPLQRWNIERGPAAPVPLHTGADMLTSLQRLGEPIGTCRTPVTVASGPCAAHGGCTSARCDRSRAAGYRDASHPGRLTAGDRTDLRCRDVLTLPRCAAPAGRLRSAARARPATRPKAPGAVARTACARPACGWSPPRGE